MKILFLLALCIACGGGDSRPEKIEKLRAIGVATSPIIQTPSTPDSPKTATITFYAAAPFGKNFEVRPFEVNAINPLTPGITIKAGSIKYQDFSQFRIFSVQASAVVPQESASLSALLAERGSTTYRFGIKLKNGEEEEKIVADLIVAAKDQAPTDIKTTKITILTPIDKSQISTETLQLRANIEDTNEGETYKIAWFVSSGQVKNRRAIETELKEAQAGPVTILVTVRGSKSGTFAYSAVDVTAM